MKAKHTWVDKVKASFVDYYLAVKKAHGMVSSCEVGNTVTSKYEPEWKKLSPDEEELHRRALTVAQMLVEYEDGVVDEYNSSVTPMCLKYESTKHCAMRGKGKFNQEQCTPCLLDPARVAPIARLRNAVLAYNKLRRAVEMLVALR